MTVNEARQEDVTSASSPPSAVSSSKWFAALGLVTGLGAVIASSCCVIPLGLAALGAGAGVLGGLNEMAAWRVPLLSVSALAVAGGWGAWWMKRRDACATGPHCATPSRTQSTTSLLLLASVIVMAAASWAYIDPVLLKLFKAH